MMVYNITITDADRKKSIAIFHTKEETDAFILALEEYSNVIHYHIDETNLDEL